MTPAVDLTYHTYHQEATSGVNLYVEKNRKRKKALATFIIVIEVLYLYC
jgi:hypothetical protein